MKLIYITSGDVSVYESQILSLLAYTKEVVEEVFLLQGYSTEKEKNSILEKHSRHIPIKTIWFKSFPVYPFYENKIKDSMYSSICQIDGYENAIFHVRSEFCGYIMKKIIKKYSLNIKVLIDIRGVVYEELKYKISLLRGKRKFLSIIQKMYYKRFYKFLFAKDDFRIVISSVSPLINDYIKKNYPACNYELLLHPNIVGNQFIYSNENRLKVRKKLGLNPNDIVTICSTAGNAIWQKDYYVIEYLTRMGIKVINLSKRQLDLENVITMTVPFTEMPSFLSAADIAVLWRDNTFMNNSASPSKFSEFASMGLYVIHNNSVEIAKLYIKESGAGLLVDDINDIIKLPSLESLLNDRQNWILKGRETFGIETLGKSYVNIYRVMSFK